MNTWIGWMSWIASGVLFQRGYIALPEMLVVEPSAQAACGAGTEPDVCGDSHGAAAAAHTE